MQLPLDAGSPDLRRALGCRPPPNSPAHQFDDHLMFHSSLPSPHGHLRALITTANRTRHDSELIVGSHCSTAQTLEGSANMLEYSHSTGSLMIDSATAHALLQLAAIRATSVDSQEQPQHQQQQQEAGDTWIHGTAAMHCREPQTPPSSPTLHSSHSHAPVCPAAALT